MSARQERIRGLRTNASKLSHAELDEAGAGECLRETGFTFLSAPHYHPAMKALVPVRKALGVRTVFNILGPLTNPAEPPFMVVGAFSPQVAALMAEALGLSVAAEVPSVVVNVQRGGPSTGLPTKTEQSDLNQAQG